MGFKKKAPIEDTKGAYAYALRLLTMREHSKYELYVKLIKKYDSQISKEIVHRCVNEGILSETRCVQMLCLHMKNCGYGPQRLKIEMLKRHLNYELLENVDEEIDWDEQAFLVLKKRLKTKPIDNLEIKKVLSMLYRRGFSSSSCICALRRFNEWFDEEFSLSNL